MSNGAVGGLIGARVSTWMEGRFGKRGSSYAGGGLCVALGLLVLLIYLSGEPKTIADLQRVQVMPEEVYLYDSKRSDGLYIVAGGVRYDLNYSLWSDRYTKDQLVRLLLPGEPVLLWIKPSESPTRTVRGLQGQRVRIGPAVGVELENDNRRALLLLALLFGVVGVSGLVYGAMQRPASVKKPQRRHQRPASRAGRASP